MEYKFSTKVKEQIEKGIEIIRGGGVIAYPTDTVYGLGAGAYIESAAQRVFEIKGRKKNMALPLLLCDASQIHLVSNEIPHYAWDLIKAFWPGGLTLIVPRSRIVNDVITGGADTVAVRMPDHPVPWALIRGAGMPIIGTSANISGRPSVTGYEEVKEQLGDKVDLIIDAEPAPRGKESTVVDVTGGRAVILRVGHISKEQIAAVTPLAEGV